MDFLFIYFKTTNIQNSEVHKKISKQTEIPYWEKIDIFDIIPLILSKLTITFHSNVIFDNDRSIKGSTNCIKYPFLPITVNVDVK